MSDRRRPDGPASEIIPGLHAGLAVFARRRDDIERILYTRDALEAVRPLTSWAASRRIPCTAVRASEIDRATQSPNHEGLCLYCRPRRWVSAAEVGAQLAKTRGFGVALDRVRNPYNVGAILRTAAFFGADVVILGAPAPHPGLAPAAVRVAEGGAEQLLMARTTDLAETVMRLRAAGVAVVATDAHARASIHTLTWTRPTVIVVGHEREGLGERLLTRCDAVVSIPGSGRLESLNVSVSAGVAIAAMIAAGGPGRMTKPASS